MPKVPTFMYSEDHPNGKQFDLDADDVAELEADGWVDNPAKVKGHPNYEGDDADGDGEGDDKDDLDGHGEKLAAQVPANNMSRPVGLPARKTASTLVNVDDGNIQDAKPAGRVRKPKTAKGDGKATTKAEVKAQDLSGKTEEELPPRPGDASSDAKTESELDAKPEVRPMTAD